MRTITITKSRSLPGQWNVTHIGQKKEYKAATSNAGEAAAKALEYRNLEVGDYIIVGHDDAIEQIPKILRTGTYK